MNRARGFIQFIEPHQTLEYETFTCAHCNSIVRMPHPDVAHGTRVEKEYRVRDARRCHSCDAFTCPTCAKVPTCTPFMKKVEAWERNARNIERLIGG